MAVRYSDMKAIRTRKLVEYNAKVAKADRKPWIVIVLDEYADLTSDPDEKKQIEALLKRLTQKARAAGIHVIAATQRPSADVISTTIRSNFPAQLALRVKTATDSRIILDETGAEALAGQGDAFLHTAKGEPWPGTVGNPVGGAVIRQAEASRLSGKDHFVGEV